MYPLVEINRIIKKYSTQKNQEKRRKRSTEKIRQLGKQQQNGTLKMFIFIITIK